MSSPVASRASVSSGGRPRHADLQASLQTSDPAQHLHSYLLRNRTRRQLLTSADPAYGFSAYFKPVILQPETNGELSTLHWIVIATLLAVVLVAIVGLLGFMLYR